MGSEKGEVKVDGEKVRVVEVEEDAKIVEWEEFQQELARLMSLSLERDKCKERKMELVEKLQPLIKVQSESLHRSNELDSMRQRLESRNLERVNIQVSLKKAKEECKIRNEKVRSDLQLLHTAAESSQSAFNCLEEANESLSGGTGYGRLEESQRMLRLRQRHMIKQVSIIYPLKSSAGRTSSQEDDQYVNTNGPVRLDGSSSSHVSKHNNIGSSSLTISGLRLSVPSTRKSGFFSDKQEIQRTATALGYVAHSVSLIASYMDVPLRYALRLGGSHSYVMDHAPPIDLALLDSAAASPATSAVRPIEFPLFLESQDTTRYAYAIFLLNKDIEQVLNSLGLESLGARRILQNLELLLARIQSQGFIDGPTPPDRAIG